MTAGALIAAFAAEYRCELPGDAEVPWLPRLRGNALCIISQAASEETRASMGPSDQGGGRKRPAVGWASLTPAELEVVRLVGQGLRNEAIAQQLFIAPRTAPFEEGDP